MLVEQRLEQLCAALAAENRCLLALLRRGHSLEDAIARLEHNAARGYPLASSGGALSSRSRSRASASSR